MEVVTPILFPHKSNCTNAKASYFSYGSCSLSEQLKLQSSICCEYTKESPYCVVFAMSLCDM